MKKTVTLALAFALVLGLLSGCANADKPADTAENTPAEETQSPAASTENFSDEMKIPYAVTSLLRTVQTPWNAPATTRTPPISPIPTCTTWNPRIR